MLSRVWAARRLEIGVVAALLAFLAATNRWMSFAAGYRLLRAHDEADYRAIALAAPHLPSGKLQEQHAQRFPFHYLIGLIASGLGANVDVVYTVAMILTSIALCALLAVILVRVGVSRPVFAVCMAVFVLNTYSLRYYGLAPGEIADLLFDLGVLAALLGLLERRLWLVLAGVAWTTLARQSALPMALALAAWVALAPDWRRTGSAPGPGGTPAPGRVRALRAAALLAASGGIYAAEVAIANPFSAHTTPGFSHLTLLYDLEHLGTSTGLGQHFVRSVNGLLSVGALLIVALIASSRARRADPDPAPAAAPPERRSLHTAFVTNTVRNVRRSLPAEFWGCVLVAATIVAQPIAFSPQYAAHNETRLSVLGVGALVCALALALRELERRGPLRLTRSDAALAIAVLAVGSLHHIYTVVGTANANQTVALQLLAGACLAALLGRALRRGAARSGAEVCD